ncbi:ABC transporter ATP-binding protein [Longirhabdus pacifica]|uniref:ABC transporter ATP-binding protein n=1 Tax=Longirhabdus pacifica TaxID=2305227 RepID=UPI001F0BA26D|nr:ABC transporter ATP-binding protein [Longirhabdus pacifica]
MGTNHILTVKHVKKNIKGKPIINDISFTVGEGEIFGFLGPNGSGKTTTIRMLVGLIQPSEGEISICGKSVRKQREEALKYVGSIVENPEMYPYLTGWENLEHFAAMLHNITSDRIAEVVNIVGMDKRIHDKVKTYSLGMRQRLGIAQALLGKPKLLILDEPTNGLDPQGIKDLRAFIRKLADEGLSIFVSSHLLSEIQMMCDRVAIIQKGETLAVGAVDELLSQTKNRILLTVSPLEKGKEALQQMDEVEILPLFTEDMESVVNGLEPIAVHMDVDRVPDVNKKLMEAGIAVYGIHTKDPTLEDMFLHLTEGEQIE